MTMRLRLDERITRLFRVLRDRGDELRLRLALTPYSETDFLDAEHTCDDELEHARRDFVRWRQSVGGRGDSFSFTRHRSRRGMADVVSGYLSSIDEGLPVIIERLRTIQVLSRPGLEVIQGWDGPDTLFYCDPPYLPETRAAGCRNVYGAEMTEQDHRELAAVLRQCRGKVALSGYPSALYDEIYEGWRTVSFEIANHAAGARAKPREAERLWLNWQD